MGQNLNARIVKCQAFLGQGSIQYYSLWILFYWSPHIACKFYTAEVFQYYLFLYFWLGVAFCSNKLWRKAKGMNWQIDKSKWKNEQENIFFETLSRKIMRQAEPCFAKAGQRKSKGFGLSKIYGYFNIKLICYAFYTLKETDDGACSSASWSSCITKCT